MAFNPFKNKKTQEKAHQGIEIEEENNQKDMSKETQNNENEKKKKFNIQLLEALSLPFVLEELGAQKEGNKYYIYQNEIVLKDNKWYDVTARKGKINAISLVKHVIAIEKAIEEDKQDKFLFVKACEFLNNIQGKQNDKIIEHITVENNSPSTIKEVVDQKITNKSHGYNPLYWKELTEQLNKISLNLVMEYIGATPNEDGQMGKWKMPTGDNVAVTGQEWYSWNAREGGIGAIGLMAFFLAESNNIDLRLEEQRKIVRRMAIAELMKTFGNEDLTLIESHEEKLVYKQPFVMPHVIDYKINQVRQYLHEKRGLPLWLINKQIASGFLFAGFPFDWEMPTKFIKHPDSITDDYVWATFLSANGTAAEMRAIERTDSFAKILAKGSDKELGGFVIKAEKEETEKIVAALEAAIDTMSYSAIYPGRVAMSCMGVTFNLAANAALEALEKGYSFALAFDNDMAGNEAAVRFKEEMIEAIGEEEYTKYCQNQKIQYFDLGLRCLQENMEKNQIFYFDVKNNKLGIEAIKMFQEQAYALLGKDKIMNYVNEGKIKYLNICPVFEIVTDLKKEAEMAFSKLSTGKPYYLRLMSDKKEKEEIRIKEQTFINELKKINSELFKKWEENGSIVYSKNVLAKDWNEYYLYKKNNDVEFIKKMQEQEKKYEGYADFKKIETKRKIKKMG